MRGNAPWVRRVGIRHEGDLLEEGVQQRRVGVLDARQARARRAVPRALGGRRRVGPSGEPDVVGEWLQGEPHTGGLLDVLTSAGLATAVIGACLLACRVAAVVWAIYPLRSFGAMSLTIYVTHVILTTIANDTFVSAAALDGDYIEFGWTEHPPLWPDLFLWQLVGFLVFASLWRWRFRRGPAEWAVALTIAGTVSESR